MRVTPHSVSSVGISTMHYVGVMSHSVMFHSVMSHSVIPLLSLNSIHILLLILLLNIHKITDDDNTYKFKYLI